MISCSSAFKSKIGGSVRYLKAYLVNDSGTAVIKSYVLKTGGMGAERFNFGTVYIPEACIITTEQLAVVKNEKIQIKLYVNDEKFDSIDGIENCIIADLYANGSAKSGDLYTVTAYGYLYLNDPVVAWSATEETVSFSDMIAKIQHLTGKTVTIKGASLTENQIQSIVSVMKVARITEQPTVRAYLSQMAESLMGYAYESVTGEFVICHGYPSEDTTGMEANVLLADVKQNFSISRLTCVLTEGYTDDDGNFIATTSLSAVGSGDSEVKYRGHTTTEEQFNMLKTDIMSVQYAPGTLTLFGNPLIEPSDAISFTDGNGETQFIICAGEITQTFNGGLQTEIIAPEAMSDADQQALDDEYATEETERQNKLTYVKADQLAATNATIQKLYAETAKLSDLETVNATIRKLDSETVKTTELEAEVAKLGYVSAETVEAQYARLDKANIGSGWIDSAMIGEGVVGTVQIADGSITDAKIVDLTANKITAGILSVERLEIRGSTGSIVYALNNITGALQAQNVDTLNGEILTERTITADKIVAQAITANEIAAGAITTNKLITGAVTADKLNVNDLSAISALIGGWELGTGYIRDLDANGHYTGIGRYGIAEAFFAGGTLEDGSDGVFRVGHDGSLYATNADIKGKIIANEISVYEKVYETDVNTGDTEPTHYEYYLTIDTEPGITTGAVSAVYIGVEYETSAIGSLNYDNGILCELYEQPGEMPRTQVTVMADTVVMDAFGTITIGGGGARSPDIYFYGNVKTDISADYSDLAYHHRHSVSGKTISFGVGASGSNRGVYDDTQDKWAIYLDSANTMHLYDSTLSTAGTLMVKNASNGRGYLWLGTAASGWYDENGIGYLQCRYKTSSTATSWSYTSIAAMMNAIDARLPIANPTATGTMNANLAYLQRYGAAKCAAVSGDSGLFGPYTAKGAAKKDNGMNLGWSDCRWTKVYAASSSISTSDEREKAIVGNLDGYKPLFMELQPIAFRWNRPDEEDVFSIHFGLGAQTTEAAMNGLGFAADGLAFLQHDYFDMDANGRTDRYGISYEEVQMLTMAVVQDHELEIRQLKEKIAGLENQIGKLTA